jgi:hypothetical protein
MSGNPGQAPDSQSVEASKPTAKEVSIQAAIPIFFTLIGFISALPTFKSYFNDKVHNQWTSWLLLGFSLAAMLGAIWQMRKLRESVKDAWKLLAETIPGLMVIIAVVWLVFAGFDIADAMQDKPVKLQPVQLAVGSENVPFFSDSQVQDVFRRNGFAVQATGFGSRQLASIDFSKYDAVIPSSQVTASQLENSVPQLKNQPEISLFRSPLAIATYQPIAACLASKGIASQDSRGIWIFNVQEYLAAVKDGLSWSDCGGDLPLYGKLLLATTNPQCSNSGEMFMADASFAHYGLVTDASTATAIGTELSPLISEQGYMQYTTDVLFNKYIVEGMGSTPMAAIYESEFVAEEINDPEAMTKDMVLMYPTPSVFSQRVLIPLPGDSAGAAVGHLIANNPDLRRLAQEVYGFRYDDPAEFQNIVGSHQIFGKQITVPLQFQSAAMPDPAVLEEIINAATSTQSGSVPSC